MRPFVLIVLGLALTACTDRNYSAVVPEAAEIGTPRTVFVGTTRAQRDTGVYSYDRSEALSLLELTVSIPPDHQEGQLDFSYGNPDPTTEFTLAAQNAFPDPDAFRARVRQELNKRPRNDREITVFVHGYNATQTETAFRAAQIAHDLEVPGLSVIYSWPSRGKVLGYVHDFDSALFARDGLEQLLRLLREAGAERLVVVAHSMGSVLLIETLRQIDLSEPGWAARSLGGVILISPDINVDVFRTQVQRLDPVPEPFLIFTSDRDNALNISALLHGSVDRLGSINDIERLSDIPVQVLDVSAFSQDAGSSHFVAATSPALIAIMRDARRVNTTFSTEEGGPLQLNAAGTLESGDAVQVLLAPQNDDL
ncbi:MAG: alpha/beta fold hydrolase [Pseudomonadota bacterium]